MVYNGKNWIDTFIFWMHDMPFETVIWLEIHLKLNSPNKLFCQCANLQEFDDLEANTHICPVCTAQPWALPVLNKEPLEKAIQLWLALWCEIDQSFHFDRKSYFYPDLPMGYQITQLAKPTNINGKVSFYVDKEFTEVCTVGIRDAHIETDTWKSTHQWGQSLLDFNRAWTPLVEIVTEPDFRSAEQVIWFLKELQRIAKYNWISDADMEKGQMRVDVNISLMEVWATEFWIRNELKNMNWFSAIQKAIWVEVARQTDILIAWWSIDQATRGRNDEKGDTYVMRSKEDAMDYRYFPEPDIPLVEVADSTVSTIRESVVEAPYSRMKRYKDQYWFNKEYINGLINDLWVNEYFETTVKEWFDPKLVATWIVWPLTRWINEHLQSIQKLPFSHWYFLSFLVLLRDGKISSSQAKTVMNEMLWTGKEPAIIVDDLWFKPVSEDDIRTWIQEIFAEKPELKEQISSWNMKPLWFITGQVMKKSGGSANPKLVKEFVMWKY